MSGGREGGVAGLNTTDWWLLAWSTSNSADNRVGLAALGPPYQAQNRVTLLLGFFLLLALFLGRVWFLGRGGRACGRQDGRSRRIAHPQLELEPLRPVFALLVLAELDQNLV